MARKIGYRGRANQPLRREFAAPGNKRLVFGNHQARAAGYAGGVLRETRSSHVKRAWADYWLPRNA